MPLLALAARPAAARSFLDRPAPEVKVAAWVVGKEPPSWKSLKGRSALLELLDPDDLVSEGLVSRTAEIAAGAEARSLLVVSVAVGTGAQEATARAFADRAKVTWTFGVDANGATFFAAGAPSLPRYFFVAPDGTVVWEGSPAALGDGVLEVLLERARLWRPDEVAKGARGAADAYARGRYSEAVRRAEKALAEAAKRKETGLPVEEGLERDGKLILDAVGATAETRLESAAGLRKERWALESLEVYESVAEAFRGTEWEEKAREGLKALKLDGRAMLEAMASRRMRAEVERIRGFHRRAIEKAIAGLEQVIKEFDGTVTADRCKAEIARLRKLLRNPAGE